MFYWHLLCGKAVPERPTVTAASSRRCRTPRPPRGRTPGSRCPHPPPVKGTVHCFWFSKRKQ